MFAHLSADNVITSDSHIQNEDGRRLNDIQIFWFQPWLTSSRGNPEENMNTLYEYVI